MGDFRTIDVKRLLGDTVGVPSHGTSGSWLAVLQANGLGDSIGQRQCPRVCRTGTRLAWVPRRGEHSPGLIRCRFVDELMTGRPDRARCDTVLHRRVRASVCTEVVPATASLRRHRVAAGQRTLLAGGLPPYSGPSAERRLVEESAQTIETDQPNPEKPLRPANFLVGNGSLVKM